MEHPAANKIIKTNGKTRESKQGGFTLIELMIVVVLMALISGFLLPMLIRTRDTAGESRGSQDTVDPKAKAASNQQFLPQGSSPIINNARIDLSLTSSYTRIGMDVYTRFVLSSRGQVSFSSNGKETDQETLLVIPFPVETMESRDVELKIYEAEGGTVPIPTDISFHKSGIYSVCRLPPGKNFSARFEYTAFGRERLQLALPPARQIHQVSVKLNISGANAWVLPDHSLQPTSASSTELLWEFRNLVSDRNIVVEIPGAQGPLAKVLLLLRYVAIAVLLFGAGFWFLSEQYKPGLLDNFRLGHFFLQALTYSLFFVVFTVLEFHATFPTSVSMLISAIVSLPLLVLVVYPILGLSFTLTRVIPMAVFTLGLVLNGVYGGDFRDYVFIFAAILVVTYTTLSYEGWSGGRLAHQKTCDEAYSARRKNLIDRITTEVGSEIGKLMELDTQAGSFQDRHKTEQLEPVIAQLKKSQELVKPLTDLYSDLSKRISGLSTQLSWEENDLTRARETDLNGFLDRLHPAREQLRNSLESAKKAAETLVVKETAGEIHCMACAKVGGKTPFCAHCGSAQVIFSTCTNCKSTFAVPAHLIPQENLAKKLFCQTCGTRLPGIDLGLIS